MAATVDSSDSAKRTHSNELPPNNNRETSQDLQKDKAKDTTLKDDISPETSKSEKTEAKADSTLDMHIQLESTLETSSEGARPLFSIGDPEKEPGEKSEGEKKLGPPPGTPSGKLELLPHTMTSTPVQEPTSASARAEPLSSNLEQLSSLSLQTNPITPAGPEEPSLFAPQSGSERGQGSDSGSRADDEAEVNTSLESQISTTTVTHESQTDLDLYDQINVPIVGYEVMEPRHKFTVFKLRVQKSKDEGWHIFRRFSDFVRLNDTLKHVFPHFRLALPPKRWIGDNFNRHFIDDRMLGLQAFLNNVVSHRDVCNSEAVRTFLCIDDPPGPHDSLEESRALCDMLEDKQYHLKQDLQSRDARIALLEEEISLYKHEVENLRRALRRESNAFNSDDFEYSHVSIAHILNLIMLELSERATVSHRRSSPISQPSESSLTEQDEASEAEADQMPESKASPEFISPEGIIGEEPDVSSEYSRNPLALSTTTVDNLLSFDEEIKAMEKTWEKSSRKEPRPINATKELSKEKLGADCPEVSKGLSATAVSS